MSWHKTTLGTLGCVALAQAAVFLFLLFPDTRETASPRLAVFDPEKGLTGFVIWSHTRLADGEFAEALPAFQTALQAELDRYARETGQIVLRKGALLSPPDAPVVDVTDVLMERVLADAAF